MRAQGGGTDTRLGQGFFSLGLCLVVLGLLSASLLAGCQRKLAQKPGPAAEQKQKPEEEPPSPLENAGSAQAQVAAKVPEPAPPAQERKRLYVVAALGDSITDARVGGGGYLRELEKLCPKSRFVNFGKGGDMTNQMRRRFEQDIRPQVQSLGLTTLLVYGGVNDLYSNLTAGRSNEVIEEDLDRIYAEARVLGLEVVAVTVSPWGGFRRYFNPERAENTRLLNSYILGQVTKGNVHKTVDSYPLLSCGDAEILCPDYETRHHDGLHPGPVGHKLLAEKLFREAFSDCL